MQHELVSHLGPVYMRKTIPPSRLWAVRWDEICACLYVKFHLTFQLFHPTSQLIISDNNNHNWCLAPAAIRFPIVLSWRVRKTDDFIPPSSFSSHLPAFIWKIFIPLQWDPTSRRVGSHLTGMARFPYKRKMKITRDRIGGWDLTSQLTAWKVGWFSPYKQALSFL